MGICLFLAALFFYNPFLTIYGSSSVLKVQPSLNTPEEAVLEAAAPAAAPSITGLPLQEPLDFQPQIFAENLWFRPPPVS
jgi:hypothetical protein